MITARRLAWESASDIVALRRSYWVSAGASAIIFTPSSCGARSHESKATCTFSRKHTSAAHTTKTSRDAGQKHSFADAIIQKGPSSTRLSTSGLRLESDIRSGAIDPLSTLKSALQTVDPDFEVVRVCLVGYEERLKKVARRQRLASVKAEGLGGLTLDWLWKDDERWAKVFLYDVGFFDTLALFLVAEGFQKYIIGIIRLGNPVSVGLDARWRGQVFRALITAQLRSDTDFSADSALDTFFALSAEIYHARQGRSREDFLAEGDAFWKTSSWPPLLQLFRGLTSGALTHTSPDKYRRFAHMFLGASRVKTPEHLETRSAEIALHMPKQPDPGPFLAILKKQFPDATSDGPRKRVLPTNARARAYLRSRCRTLLQVLQQQKRTADAEWVTSFTAKYFDAADHKHFREVTIYPNGIKSPGVKMLKSVQPQKNHERFVDYSKYGTVVGEIRGNNGS